jgi:hypothetical protein
MRQILGALLTVGLLLGGATGARAVCGDGAGDADAVTSVESSIVAQCTCCSPRPAFRACVAGVLRAAYHAHTMPARCMAPVRRDVVRTCPLRPATTPCRVCNADADCATGEFCECRVGSCAKTAGVCVPRPAACPDVVAPVCGCDGVTYANDCLREQAGACKLHVGPCSATGGCFDAMARTCTGASCSPASGCPLPNQFCSPACASPPPTGRCFDTLLRRCTAETCDPSHPCTLPNAFCVATCPPPTPSGRCFVTVDDACSTEPCGPGAPCVNPNELCDPRCLATTTTTIVEATTTTTTLPSGGCTTDKDCDDGNGCTVDHCVGGVCEHACICLDATGAASCCPGPAALCAIPCGGPVSSTGTCGGFCPGGATCGPSPAAATCACFSGLGGPCGGNILAPPPICGPGLVCQQSNPDVTGVCVAAPCIPLFTAGCTQTSDCCEPCGNGRIAPCGVCINGECVGAP